MYLLLALIVGLFLYMRGLRAEVQTMKAETAAKIAELAEEVTENRSLVGSIKDTLAGLAKQIEDLKNGVEDPAIHAALTDAADIVRTNNDEIAAAITANTTPEPPPV
jgi:ferritin-like metal-binding protein YciE